ncbi:VCBS repeat-containing protein, partial [bacterium]|nr:VCBS repeat-containing protein [bacterium]
MRSLSTLVEKARSGSAGAEGLLDCLALAEEEALGLDAQVLSDPSGLSREALVLTALDHARANLSATAARDLYDQAVRRGADARLSALERQIALETAVHVLVDASNGELDFVGDLEPEKARLSAVLLDTAESALEDVELRKAAARSAGALGTVDSAMRLQVLAESAQASAVRRAALVGLLRADPSIAGEAASRLMCVTDDPQIFATAASVLGYCESRAALDALLRNGARMKGQRARVGAAVWEYARWIDAALAGSDARDLHLALEALDYVQGYRADSFRRILLRVLEARGETLSDQGLYLALLRLQSACLTPLEAARVLYLVRSLSRSIPDICQPVLDDLASLSEAASVVELPSRQTPKATLGNEDAQEYGDALYRELGEDWWPSGLEWMGHAAIYAGMEDDDDHTILEVSTGGIHETDFSHMRQNDYIGAYQSKNSDTAHVADTFAERKAIIQTAIQMDALDPAYPVLGFDCLVLDSGVGDTVSPNEIEKLRCDGLVEYCFEANGFWVWGREGKHHDISDSDYTDEHNTLFYWEQLLNENPNKGLAPVVQRGGEGGSSTYLTRSSVVDNPVIEVLETRNEGRTIVHIRASDQSGVHRLRYRWGANGTVQELLSPQHPDVDYLEAVDSTGQNETLYAWAMDNAGNTDDVWHEYVIVVEDETAPAPDPMAWSAPPHIIGAGTIQMIASTAVDPSGVEYRFESYTAGGHSSDWQNSRIYVDGGLATGTAYAYAVQARDKSAAQNASAFSAQESATILDTQLRWIEGYGYGSGYRMDRHIRALADVKGDGREDIVAFGDNGVQVATSTGSAFEHAGFWDRLMTYASAWRVEKNPRFAEDVTGDGKADIIGFGDKGVFIGESTGSAFTAPEMRVSGFGYRDGWRVREETADFHLHEIWTAEEQFCLAQEYPGQYMEHPRFIEDIDGDGAMDIAGFGPEGVTVALNNGDGTFQPASVWFNGWHGGDGWTSSQHVRLFADLNGDGFLDIVGIGQRKVAICLCEDTNADGRGDAYLTPQGWQGDFSAGMAWQVALHPRMAASVNGDDLADLVCFGDRGVLVSLCNGTDFLAPEQRLKDEFCRNAGWTSPVLF